MFTDVINLSAEWLNMDKQELKILVMVSMSDKAEYKGNLTSICNWLGVSASSVNNNRIKMTLKDLQNKGYISYNVTGQTYTISINEIAKDNIIPIRKQWIDELKQYNRDEYGIKIDKSISIDWIQILKVFAFLYNRKQHNTITYAEISKHINYTLSESTISTAITAIKNCNLKGILFNAKTIIHTKTDLNGNKTYRTEGTNFDIIWNFEDM